MSDLLEVVPAIIEELETTNSGPATSAFESPAPTSGIEEH